MRSIYQENLDIHSFKGAKLSNMEYNVFLEMKNENLKLFNHFRQIGKTLNFGLLYSLSVAGVLKILEKEGIFYTFQQCQEFYTTWHRTFPNIREFHRKVLSDYNTRKDGDIFKTYLDEFQYKNYQTSIGGLKNLYENPQDAKLNAIANFPVQATCAEILKYIWVLSLNLNKEIFGEIIYTLHDEILVLCKPENIERIKQAYNEILSIVEKKYNSTIPLILEY